jgi:Arc/MetJ-type ribon-helix-helix transcriptional regulator
MTERDTFVDMAERAISVRLDVQAQRALDALLASGMSQSQAIRYALVQAASRGGERRSLTVEAMRLSASEDDRRVKAELLEFMGEPAEPR